ncbi:MAG: phage holin family protein [Pigmentiphaga sp.]|uniref:phage holin family protein n=1 Tax=Pigmentiphaga sp. TaxID=1977564 RepID=UPI0029A56AF3|nr:phage holin family protein [Pigmentiphaga sp.]MDX3904754.1 phage holin family protein [Pigmentiphaga sp.]
MSESPHLLSSLRTLAATCVGILRTRLELVAIELAEEKSRLMGMLLVALAALLCLTLGLMMFSFLIVVVFWDTEYRHLAIALVGAAYLLVGLVMLFMVRRQASHAPIAFDDTLAELQRDRDMLAAVADADRGGDRS